MSLPHFAPPLWPQKAFSHGGVRLGAGTVLIFALLVLLLWQIDSALGLALFSQQGSLASVLLLLMACSAALALALDQHQRQPAKALPATQAATEPSSLPSDALTNLAFLYSDLVALSDGSGYLRYLNREGRRLLELPPNADIGQLSIHQLFPLSARNLERLDPPPESAWRGETVMQTLKGERLPVQQTLVKQDTAGEVQWLVMARDLSEREKSRQALWNQTHRDSLTGLPNRSLLEEQLTAACAALADGEMLALTCFSIGRFRDVNDVFGQQAGDGVLKEMASRFKAAVPDALLLARIGGTEFALALRGVGVSGELPKAIEKLCAETARPVLLGDSDLRFVCNLGVALFPQDARTTEQLIGAAEIALRQAKRQGPGRCEFYSQGLDRDARAQLFLESHLRQALANDELRLEFQPQIRLSDGRMCGVEALLRWQHPSLGTIWPGRFIPVAEASGLIVPIGEWVLRSACYQQVAWQRAGLPALRMAINLSAQQFLHADVVAHVENAIAYSGVNPEHLELEITESVLMEDAAAAKKLIQQMAGLGVKTAIDDFGTGYSSLAYLKEFPLDRIKIDRSFVSDVPHNENVSIITRTILSLAQSLGMGTIAEGVENTEQIDFLQQHGCEELQGFLFSRPLPPTLIEEFLEHNEACAATAVPTGNPYSLYGETTGTSAVSASPSQ